jgi:hypothetical protein
VLSVSAIPQIRVVSEMGILRQFVRNSGRCLLFNKRIGVTMQELQSTVFLSNCLELGSRRSP